MQNINQKKLAEFVLILKNILSALFPVLTVIAYTNSLSPFATLAWSSLIASILFGMIVTIQKGWRENVTNVEAIKDIFFVVLFVAIGFHALYFLALKFTSPQNVTLLSLMEVVFSFIIIGFITKKEPISKQHAIGASLMLLSAIIILFSNKTNFNIGDLFILTATILAPIGNIFAKRALHQVSLSYLLFVRSIVAMVLFFIATWLFEPSINLTSVINSWPYLLFSGLIFLGLLKIITMFGFKKTSVSHTISFNSLKPVFTIIFAWWLLNDLPTTIQIVALVPSFAGLYLLATAKQQKTRYGFESKNLAN